MMALRKSESTMPMRMMVLLERFRSSRVEMASAPPMVARPQHRQTAGKRKVPTALSATPVTMRTAAPSPAPEETPRP